MVIGTLVIDIFACLKKKNKMGTGRIPVFL